MEVLVFNPQRKGKLNQNVPATFADIFGHCVHLARASLDSLLLFVLPNVMGDRLNLVKREVSNCTRRQGRLDMVNPVVFLVHIFIFYFLR